MVYYYFVVNNNNNCVYVNDMHRFSNQMRFVHFADDTSVICASDSDINNVHTTVNW